MPAERTAFASGSAVSRPVMCASENSTRLTAMATHARSPAAHFRSTCQDGRIAPEKTPGVNQCYALLDRCRPARDARRVMRFAVIVFPGTWSDMDSKYSLEVAG